MKIIKGFVTAYNARIAIVIARFNNFINNNLLNSAVDILERVGQVKNDNITIIWVPGAYELPLTVNVLINNHKYDAIIALGTIIRGSTMHAEYISQNCISGLSVIAMHSMIPVTIGILITENIEQAIERAGTKMGNNGAKAALTSLEMINVLQSIKN